jgi:zeaxanthin glucosyltransferase
MDNMALLKRRLRSNSIPREYSPRKNSLFSTTFTEVPELILSQAEFDLHDRHDAHQQHVGFMVDMSRTHASEATFFKWTSLHLQDRPLVYCAFGTVPSDNVHDVANFLRILIDVVKNNNYACAITCQASLISQFKNYEDASILLSEQLPQLAVLKLAKVFITHGGLNSIKESIIMKVPMIVYPVNKKTDQNGNATRVVNHRLGLRGDLRKDSRAEIENKLKRVLNDSSFQESSNPFLARDLRYDGKFLDAFNNLGVLK